MTGMLYVVATPIGHLDDWSARAQSVLQQVDLLLCEDTRRTKILLGRYGIDTPTYSYHMHNEAKTTGHWIEVLKRGKSIALVSDAGTPCIADPGYLLVDQAHQQGIKVVPIPGPNAALTLLSASGLPADRWTFYGFLPRKEGQRMRILKEIDQRRDTALLYESPRRILALLQSIMRIWGPDHRIVMGRELTKAHEEVCRQDLEGLWKALRDDPKRLKGEFVLAIPPRSALPKEESLERYLPVIRLAWERGASVKDLSHVMAETLGKPRAKIYQQLLDLLKS